MLFKFLLGSVAGAALSAGRRAHTNVSLAVNAPTLDDIMDPSKDIVPIRAVIVGGGFTGSKLAYQLDSMFEVTHIDEKNFYELTNDIIPIIANKWEDRKHEEACRRMMVLHRYYLKRSNVLTGTVDGVDDSKVQLRDGRVVPYDLLFVTTGEQKPFPFHTTQRTINGRVQELRHFNTFLGKCKKVAVVGGGPVGTSLAHDLATSRPELQVHLYHSHSELMPVLPGLCRRYALEKLEKSPNLHIHLSTRVTAVEGVDVSGSPVTEAAPRSGWRMLLFPSPPPKEPVQFSVKYDALQYERRRSQSIISQVYFGKRDDVEDSWVVEGQGEEHDFDYVFPLTGDTPRPIVAGKNKPNILKEHETPDGHYRTSTLMQLFGHPTIFAAGRCTNFPISRCYGSGDIQARTLFRELNSLVNNPTSNFLHSRDGLQLSRLKIPRLHVRLGTDDAVGCTPWSGGLTGVPAVHEFMQDRNYLLKEFMKPVFYKQQDPMKVKQRISRWMEDEITDIVDFSHC